MDVTPQQVVRHLRESFDEARSRNSSLSLRKFAYQRGLNSGALSQILAGKRKISQKMATRLAVNIGLYPGAETSEYTQITADQHALVAQWEHFAILSLAKLRTNKADPAWIARRLSLSRRDAETALKRLISIGLLVRLPSGKMRRTQKRFTTTDNVPSSALVLAHANNLELARESLHRDSVDVRDFSAMTLVVDPSRLDDARKIIRKAQDDICALLESGRTQEVYKLCVQLFPLSKSES